MGMSGEPDRGAVRDFIEAAMSDRTLARRMLAENPRLLDARFELDETPLHFLAVESEIDAVKFLAVAGSDVNATNKFGDTPLLDVATVGNTELAQVLLFFGADPNATSRTRDNVLHAAVGSGNPDLVDLLLRSGADPKYETALGETIRDALPSDPDARQAILGVFEKHGIAAE
jgi:ankyrin repeat protein